MNGDYVSISRGATEIVGGSINQPGVRGDSRAASGGPRAATDEGLETNVKYRRASPWPVFPWFTPPMSQARSQISELIAAARKARPGALDGLLDLYRNYLRLVAQTSIDAAIQAKADASDMAQETIIKAHENFGQFQGSTEAELLAWLRQILAHNIADLGRRYRASSRRVSREMSLEDAMRSSADAIDNFVAGEGSSPSHAYQRREMAVVLADALAALSPDHREVIILRSIEELDWPEIGRKMDRTPDAARVLWARALKQLRPQIEQRL
ncbi:MAG TPA: sigma-70 family RNA polymerase sigma factor [Pirellulales bacterium]|nr:sigma-70 family RNA polymerase sigma factor [Pirellulales bacterium]